MSTDKTILFIGHEATRTGAPKSLLQIIRWFKVNTSYNLKLLLLRGGELCEEYAQYATVLLYENIKPVQKLSIKNRIIHKVFALIEARHKVSSKTTNKIHRVLIGEFNFQKRLAEIIEQHFGSINLIFNNTTVTADLVNNLILLDAPVISRIAEMGLSYSPQFDVLNRRTKHFFVVSKAVRDDLIKRYSINPERITILYGTIYPEDEENKGIETLNIREKLAFGKNSFIVMGSGSRSYRKGVDLFVQVAIQTYKINKDIIFIWLGGCDDKYLGEFIKEEKQIIKEYSNLYFINSVPKPSLYYKEINLFLMTSREDPFPLVNLEVGLQKKTIISFENNGGSPELIKDGETGYLVPFLDTSAMTDKILKIYNGEEASLGENLYKEIISNYTQESSGQLLKKFINKELNI